MAIDAPARSLYSQEIQRMSAKLRAEAMSRRITWAAAARQAQETRNLIMEIIRTRSTPVGRAFAESMKKNGYSLNQLIALKTIELHERQTKRDLCEHSHIGWQIERLRYARDDKP